MIVRTEHREGYYCISNDIARDTRLSIDAKGLLFIMLSNTDDWSFSVRGLAKQAGCGTGKITKLLQELQETGYLVLPSSEERFSKAEWIVYESPVSIFAIAKTADSKTADSKMKTHRSTNVTNTIQEIPEEERDARAYKEEHTREEIGPDISDLPSLIQQETEEPARKSSSKKFVPPTREEVRQYCVEKGLRVNPDKFYDYFTADPERQWIDSRGNPVKSWKQKLLTWESKEPRSQSPPTNIVARAAPTPIEDEFDRLRRKYSEGGGDTQ